MEASPARLVAGNPKSEIREPSGGGVNSAPDRGFGRVNRLEDDAGRAREKVAELLFVGMLVNFSIRVFGISEQEQRLVRLLASEAADKEISGQLGIGEHSLAWHLRILFRDFNVRCRAALVARCLGEGLAGGASSLAPVIRPSPRTTRTCS